MTNRDENIPSGFLKYTLTNEQVTASSFETKEHGGFSDFPPYMTIDGDISNAKGWRAENDGQWIQYDFTIDVPVDIIFIAFMKGEERSYFYSLLIRKDQSKEWETILNRAESQKLQGFQRIALPGFLQCRYIKIVGHGNSNPEFKNWININEIRFLYKK